jgi:MFS family permease
MPDTIPGEYRSEANGVINTMGGLAAITGAIGLSKLMDLSVTLPIIGDTARKLPFVISGVLVIAATALLFLRVKEKAAPAEAPETEKRAGLGESLRQVFRGWPRASSADDPCVREKSRSAVYLLFAVFFWFFGYQGILPFLTMYTRDVIGVSEGMAGFSPGMFALSYALCAIPAGFIAHRIGRRKTIRAALCGMAVLCLLLFFHGPLTARAGLSRGLTLAVFWALLFLMGIFWVAVTTNSFPMLWQMASYKNIGIYTGLYYTFSQAAAILSPPVTGFLIDLRGFRYIFAFAAMCMLFAVLCMGRVVRGEVEEMRAPSTLSTLNDKKRI